MLIALIVLGAIVVFLGVPLLVGRRLNHVSESYRSPIARRLRRRFGLPRAPGSGPVRR